MGLGRFSVAQISIVLGDRGRWRLYHSLPTSIFFIHRIVGRRHPHCIPSMLQFLVMRWWRDGKVYFNFISLWLILSRGWTMSIFGQATIYSLFCMDDGLSSWGRIHKKSVIISILVRGIPIWSFLLGDIIFSVRCMIEWCWSEFHPCWFIFQFAFSYFVFNAIVLIYFCDHCWEASRSILLSFF